MNSIAWECLRILSKLLEAIKKMTQITFKVSYEHATEANRKTQKPPKKPLKISSVKSPEPGRTRWPSCVAHRVTSVVNVTRLHQIITHDMQSGNLRVFVCLFILLIIASLLQCLPTQTCRLTGQPPPWGNETVNKCGDNAVLKSVPRTIIWMLCSILGNPSTTAFYK